MPRYRDAERDQVKEEMRRRLLAAALPEFAQEGYAGANINRISQAAGYAQGTVYNYYPSKRALFQAVVNDIAAQHCELVLQGAAIAPGPSARLERFFAAGFAFAEGSPAAVRVISAALHDPDPELRACAHEAYRPLREYVEREIVQAGVLGGEFRLVDTGLATALVLAVYVGGCSGDEDGGRIRTNARAAAALLLEGLRRKRGIGD